MCAGVGVGIDFVAGVRASLAVIRREVSDAGGDLSIASVWAAQWLENLCPTVGVGAVGRLEDGVGAAVLNRWL